MWIVIFLRFYSGNLSGFVRDYFYFCGFCFLVVLMRFLVFCGREVLLAGEFCVCNQEIT